jgi:hypothetical protein
MAARPIAVLKLSPRVKNVISFAQAVATAMTGNASFASPNPPLATFEADIAALVTAETAVLSRVKGAVETRNAKFLIVKNDLGVMRTYVQSIADGNPSDAAAIIESAGMKVRTVTLHDKPELSVKLGDVSGSVLLVAKAAADRAAYDWQYSTDQKTWTAAPQTLKAKTSISGLTAGTIYYFRVQSLIKTGEQNWSQVVYVLVS